MTARTRTAKTSDTKPAPAKKTAAKKTAAATNRPARKRIPRKPAPGTPKLSLVKTRADLPTRELPFMTDTQGYATLAARIVGIPTLRIRDWRDHRDGTATRPLRDGSTLHYNLNTRTLTWQAVCRMGAIHQYELDTPSMACAARLHADGCKQLHADLSTVPGLTGDELEALGLLQIPTWAGRDPLGDISATIRVDLPEQRERALGDELTHSGNSVDDTQPMSTDAIAAHIAEQAADNDHAKEHPQP